MSSLEQKDANFPLAEQPAITLSRLPVPQMVAISIFWFAFNFHWSAISLIILPSQVAKIVGQAHQGEALAFVLIPGAFVSLFANPLFGLLSDQTRGRLAFWGRRRPYIFVGTLVNVALLAWMASGHDTISLMIAYALVQLASNAAQAPFHALLPDIVPKEQRGMVSGLMGFLWIGGNVAGALVASMFVDSSKPQAAYDQGVWLAYASIMIIMVVLMLITVFTVNERIGLSARYLALEAEAQTETEGNTSLIPAHRRPAWLTRSLITTVGYTLGTIVILWIIMFVWNSFHIAGLQLSSDIQQVVLEVVATVGLLRLFDFRPRRNPDFAWVLATRLLMMLGIYTIQTFLQYYMRDVVRVSHPEQQTTNFVILVSLASLLSAFIAGWLSDRFGRKRMIYLAGGLMGVVGLVFILDHMLVVVLAAGAIFGLGYGIYQSVDWALVADVLPSHRHYARDMGVWNISLSLPQVIAPVIGGPLIDAFTSNGQTVLGYQILFGLAIIYCLLGTVTIRYIRAVK
jgi:Na+/melibiose symporter-like transporter